ncbi:MAG: hypothetical protein K2P55_10450 [Bacteroides acidifaciens]|uniref:hypothetical protein n=1 Tax=Bacteroides acidifaciens TaxID=85831 RepID=UPI0023D7543D|nr:hypothetical protein [Bacteroides acidifaciens]MDE6819598.1 hypothetical protein [Bacteroides acidifaciens]MDE6987318.1 hypothetical protein [Bacteroides acidifaciens]
MSQVISRLQLLDGSSGKFGTPGYIERINISRNQYNNNKLKERFDDCKVGETYIKAYPPFFT